MSAAAAAAVAAAAVTAAAAAATAACERNNGNGEGYNGGDTGSCTAHQSGFIEKSCDSQGERSCNSEAAVRGGSV